VRVDVVANAVEVFRVIDIEFHRIRFGPLDLQGLIFGIIADGDGRGRSDNDLVAHILDLQSCYRQALYPAFCRFHDSSDYIILFPCEMNNDGDIIPKIAKEVISCRDEENLT